MNKCYNNTGIGNEMTFSLFLEPLITYNRQTAKNKNSVSPCVEPLENTVEIDFMVDIGHLGPNKHIYQGSRKNPALTPFVIFSLFMFLFKYQTKPSNF